MNTYDYPLNERVRSWLRIEDLIKRTISNLKSDHDQHHLLAIQALLQLVDVIDRAEIKLELLQELDRQSRIMQVIKEKRKSDAEKFNVLINDIAKISQSLQNDNNKLGQHLRINEWLMTIKQRLCLPGGMPYIDTPSFQHWLSLDSARRRQDLTRWLRPLIPMQQAIYILLHLTRNNGKVRYEVAKAGVFHELIGKQKPAQMLRIEIPDQSIYYPEISANRYAINIRFYQLNEQLKATKEYGDVPFDLTLCYL